MPKAKTAQTTVSEQQIAVRAYERWMGRGCPASDGVEDWTTARSELEAELATPTPKARARKPPSSKPKSASAPASIH